MEKKNHAVAYVDGSYSNNTAGYGVVFFYEDAKEPEYFSGRCKNASMNNVSGEIEVSLFAVNKALEYGCSSIDIFYDYTGIEYWATGVWRAKKKETMAYRDQMNFFKGMIDIQFHHVEAHTGDRWNEKADDLAINAVLGKKEEKIKEENGFLFESDEPAPTIVKGTNGGSGGIGGKKPSEMTYSELCDYMEQNPGAEI